MQYEDDSLEAWFADGARILLTACGSAFTRQEDATNGGIVQPPRGGTVHQFTAYAVQRWRERVRQLLVFRNYFAERPFLVQSLMDTELQVRLGRDFCCPFFKYFLCLLHSRGLTLCCSTQRGPPTWRELSTVNWSIPTPTATLVSLPVMVWPGPSWPDTDRHSLSAI